VPNDIVRTQLALAQRRAGSVGSGPCAG
jgi:hypothetical protein